MEAILNIIEMAITFFIIYIIVVAVLIMGIIAVCFAVLRLFFYLYNKECDKNMKKDKK